MDPETKKLQPPIRVLQPLTKKLQAYIEKLQPSTREASTSHYQTEKVATLMRKASTLGGKSFNRKICKVSTGNWKMKEVATVTKQGLIVDEKSFNRHGGKLQSAMKVSIGMGKAST